VFFAAFCALAGLAASFFSLRTFIGFDGIFWWDNVARSVSLYATYQADGDLKVMLLGKTRASS